MKPFNETKLTQMAEFIKDYIPANNGQAPSLTELMQATGMAKATAYRYLKELDRRGVVHYSGKNTLEIAGERYKKSSNIRLPILGQIICGSPEEEEEYAEGYLAIPEEWIQGECYLLRAYGDSMVDIGIEAGDLVLVKRTTTPADGQVVVALTDQGNTLKRLRYENRRPVLIAENCHYAESERVIRPRELTIQGVALKLIKDIR